MSVWWIEEFTVQQQMEMAEQQGADIVPGWEQPDGNHKAVSLWCRTGSIPKNLHLQDVKDAAFYFSTELISDEIVADEYCGSDRVSWTIARKRGTITTWPTNSGIRPLKRQDLTSMVVCE